MAFDGNKRVIVVGGGLVGALNACFLAQRGFHVDLFESRPDIRKEEFVKGRSINLALSVRGRAALRAVGLEDKVVQNGIAMHSRMIHDIDGTRRPIPYGNKDQYIMSVDRRQLNEVMLTAAEEQSNVSMHFNHKLVSCDFDKGEVSLKIPSGEVVTKQADFIIGADGAYSAMRREMMKRSRMNYNQDYIPHGYLELCIPAVDNEYAMETNYLHIWPRNKFMMIALPNAQDNSFVVTLFMPFEIFDTIKTPDDLMEFFEDKFPDSIPLLGRESLKKMYFSTKAQPLVTVKCSPYHAGKGVIMGDAAHAMVPFYGQGMNCGFEDCLIFDGLLNEYDNDIEKVLPLFTQVRNEDAKAICDLALYNYIEMRESVNSQMFLLRKKLDNILFWMFPNTWIPLYTMVSFSRTPYSECIKRRKWQDKVLNRIFLSTALATCVSGTILGWNLIQSHTDLAFKLDLGSWANSLFSRLK